MRRPILSQLVSGVAIHAVLDQHAIRISSAKRAGAIVLLIANGKGGSGKSTLALNLAMAYRMQGKRVLVIDADIEQRTVGKWPRPPELAGPTILVLPTSQIVAKLAELISGYDIVLIDMAGRDDRAAGPVMSIADLLISPAKPSHQDLLELDRYIRLAEAKGVPHVVIFNEATRESSAELRQLVQEFSRFKPFLPVALQQLQGYRRAYSFGRSVLEYRPGHPARENFIRAFDRIDAVIMRSRATAGHWGARA